MTALTTWQEAREVEALRFAREKIAQFKEARTSFSGHSPLTPEASQAFFRHMSQMGLQNAVNRMQIVAAAKAGDPDAVDLLKAVLLEAKSSRRVDELPTELVEYDMWLTAHGEQRTRRSEKRDYVTRDICIALTVAGVVDKYGMAPTGRSARRRSACEIVGEALFEGEATKAGKTAHLRKSYEAVKKVWDKYKQAMPTVPGWASTW